MNIPNGVLVDFVRAATEGINPAFFTLTAANLPVKVAVVHEKGSSCVQMTIRQTTSLMFYVNHAESYVMRGYNETYSIIRHAIEAELFPIFAKQGYNLKSHD